MLFHDLSVARQYATKLLVGIASIFGFRLLPTDVTQEYIQSAEELNRQIFINPPKELKLKPDELIKLLKPIYGLAESEDYWDRTFRNNIEKYLGMKSFISDAALCYKTIGEKRVELCATYVDDTLHTCNKKYSKLCDKTKQKFK